MKARIQANPPVLLKKEANPRYPLSAQKKVRISHRFCEARSETMQNQRIPFFVRNHATRDLQKLSENSKKMKID